MKKIINYIIVSTIILQSVFGFILPAQAQTGLLDPNTNQPIGDESTTEPAGQIYDLNRGEYVSTETAVAESAAAQKANKETNKNSPPGLCSWDWTTGFSIFDCTGNVLLIIGGAFVGITGTFLNFSIDITVLQMSKFINEVGVITAGWKTFRDLANMFFIFILIYIAIMTIVGASSGETKKMLVQLIIVALLINFSMFFTKVVVDASNILAIQFYNSISKGPSTSSNGFSWVFMNASRLTTIYSSDSTNGVTNEARGFRGSNILLIGFFGLIFGIILSFCFLAIGILFVIRFVVLLFLMMLSPIALLGTVISGLSKVWSMWKESLIREAIFAPTIMALLWIVASIVNNPAFINAINRNGQTSGGFFSAISETGKDSMAVLVNFGILIAMLIGSLVISKSFSGSAGGSVLGVADKWSRKVAGGMTFGAAGFAGRQTVGRMASGLSNINALKTNRLGLAVQKGFKGVASSSFDARASTLVGAGLQGAGLGTGVEGGFIEQRQKFRTLRDKVFQRDEESVEALDSNKRKLEIEKDIKDMRAGAGAVAGTPPALAAETAKARLKENLSKLSEEEQVQMMSTATQWFKNIGDQKEIIETLSPAAIKAIKKKAGLTPQEKEKITKLREQKLRDDLVIIKTKAKGSSEYENAVKNLRKTGAEELEIISDDIFEIQEFVENLSRKQTKSLLDSKEISSLNKDKFKKKREEHFVSALQYNPDQAKSILGNMVGEEIARMDIKEMTTGSGSNTFKDYVSARQLADAAENLRPSDIALIKESIRNRSLQVGRPADSIAENTAKWFDSGGGRQIFS